MQRHLDENRQFNLRDWLHSPMSVFLCVIALATAAVVLDGTAFRIWSLNRDRDRLETRIESLKQSVSNKERLLIEANRPEYIERQAREQLDFVRDGDLVFVFSNSDVDEPQIDTVRSGVKATR